MCNSAGLTQVQESLDALAEKVQTSVEQKLEGISAYCKAAATSDGLAEIKTELGAVATIDDIELIIFGN